MRAANSNIVEDGAFELRAGIAALRATGIHRAEEFSPLLLEALRISPTQPSSTIRELVRRSLLACTDRLNPRHRQAFLEAAGFRRDAAASRGARLQATADLFGVSERTAYRIVDDAIDDLAAMLTSSSQRCILQDVDYVFASSRCRVDLSDSRPAVVMERTITAHSEGIDHIDERVGYPRLAGERLNLRALEGCGVEDTRFIAPGIWSLRLRFPRALRIGEQHSFAVSVIFPDHESLEPVVGFLPHTASYDARVELIFGDTRPGALQRFATIPPLEPETHVPEDQWMPPAGSRHEFVFTQMRPGMCYGVRWRW